MASRKLCDFSNGLIYLAKGEKFQAGASIVAVIPIVGMVGKGAGQAIKLTAKETAEVAAKVTADKAAKEAAEKLAKEAAERAARVAANVFNSLKLARSIPELVQTADSLKVVKASSGLGKFFVGTKSLAKELFDTMTAGWGGGTSVAEKGIITYKTSPDGRFALNYREFYSDTLPDAVKSVEATVDVVEYKVYNEGIRKLVGTVAEIKFGSLK